MSFLQSVVGGIVRWDAEYVNLSVLADRTDGIRDWIVGAIFIVTDGVGPHLGPHTLVIVLRRRGRRRR